MGIRKEFTMLNSKELNVINKLLDDTFPNPMSNILLWATRGLEQEIKTLPPSDRAWGCRVYQQQLERAMDQLDAIRQDDIARLEKSGRYAK
jgi:hypothetical protein